MSTKRGLVPAASDAFSNESMSPAAAPCGAAQNTADVGSLAISAAMSACDLNARSPSVPARCENDLPASSPGALSDITPASAKFGWPTIRRSSSPDTYPVPPSTMAGMLFVDIESLIGGLLVRRAVQRASLREPDRIDDRVAECGTG